MPIFRAILTMELIIASPWICLQLIASELFLLEASHLDPIDFGSIVSFLIKLTFSMFLV